MAIDVKFLKGTTAAYNALTTKNPNTFYYLDDKDLFLGSVKLSSEAGLAAAIARVAANESDIDDIQAQLAALTTGGAGSITTQINNAVTALKNELEPKITANTNAIAAINNADTGILKQAKDYTDAEIAKVNAKIGTIPADKTIAELIAEAKADATYDDTAIKASIKANTDAIGVLNGAETAEGSVKKQVADAVAKIVADAPEAYDTLKEISDWISGHDTDAAGMNSQIQANKTGLAALKTLVGELPEDATATDVVAYIKEAVDAAKTALEAADATTLAAAKAYTDGKAGDYATAAQGAKADTAVQEVAEGTANGTVKVDGTDVAVHGLKSAAYAEATAFDAAGAAATAEANAKAFTTAALTWGAIE